MFKQARKSLTGAIALLAVSGGFSSVHADELTISVKPVRQGIHMLVGRGGNVGVLTGKQGLLVIDDQYADSSEELNKALASMSDKPVEFLINTHWHSDHTGGNRFFGGKGANIVAHENVRKRLLSGGEIAAFGLKVPPAKSEALPVMTYDQGMRFYWNGQSIELTHPNPAHTDGDTVVYFKEANVVHTGDLYFNGLFPFIDASSGGRIRGVIEGVDSVLARIDDKTLVIPGHGPLSKKAELQAYRDMLNTVADRVEQLKAAGKTRDEVIAAKPTAEFDKMWGDGFLTPDVWTGIVFDAI